MRKLARRITTKTRTVLPRGRRDVKASLDRQLASYAVAASAACIGIFATTVAEGKIVYTPTNVSMVDDRLPIDLNNDGILDFEIVEFLCGSRTGCVFANPLVAGNGIKGSRLGAFAGAYGLPVGPQGQFLTQLVRVTSTASGAAFMAAAGGYGGQSVFSNGPWANCTNKYLGLKFLIDGKVHYGWARLTVKLFNGGVTLTGYAYETIPNHMIMEGPTEGLISETISPTNPTPDKSEASLGMLARGVDGLSIWRREDSIATPQ